MASTFASGSYVMAASIRIVPDGGTFNTSETASSSNRPDTGETGWTSLPYCDKLEIQNEKEFRDVKAPVGPGFRVRIARHHVASQRTFKGTFKVVDMRMIQCLFGAATIDGTDDTFVPGAATADKMAWVNLKIYDSDNTLQGELIVWCRVAVVDTVTLDDNEVNVTLEMAEVYNSANDVDWK